MVDTTLVKWFNLVSLRMGQNNTCPLTLRTQYDLCSMSIKCLTRIYATGNENENVHMRERGRGRKKLKQTMLSMDPLRGSISQPWDRDLSWNQESDTNWLHHPGAHELEFFVYKWRKQCLSHRNFLRTNYMKASCKVYASVIWGVCGLKSWLGKEVKSLSNRKWSHH